jgi:hypothetical protein
LDIKNVFACEPLVRFAFAVSYLEAGTVTDTVFLSSLCLSQETICLTQADICLLCEIGAELVDKINKNNVG